MSRTKCNLLIILLAVLAACSPGKPTASNGSGGESEQLLTAARGPWSLVEEKDPGGDPMAEHMAAREKVNPSAQASTAQYTSKPTAEDMNEPMHFRVLKLERQMEGLKNDLDKLLPPPKTLASSDDQLDSTLSQIKERQKQAAAEHVAQYTRPAPPVPGDVKKERAPKEVTVEPASGAAGVTAVRIGEHPGKVRVVLDLSGPAEFRAEVNNEEKLVLVELPGTVWSAEAQKALKNQLLKGYATRVNAAGDGTIMAIGLAGPAKLVSSEALVPNETYGHRIALDIAAQ